MKNKVLVILAASAAALGSAIIAAPANAQTANLPVEIQIKPGVFLRTYESLKFVVSTQDLLGGKSVDQVGKYDETTGTITPLPKTAPPTEATTEVIRTVTPLYQVWGGTGSKVKITPTKDTLVSSTNGGLGSADTVVMSVVAGNDITTTPTPAGTPYEGTAQLKFKFSNGNTSSGTNYTGGQLSISVVSP
ncbi:hypothetical protein PI95_029915 [Hassallia byssoidea VB512170]|uniref:WxL domain-containing protein n=1 Tax=Hassallia byssoidea VB512170 TaxID=1304833 RepID=A0A846HHT2_9CYAN|nr:hypothetical protein [Hassalia byssoidea]NEU76613.1 hypothetical protein [Hassalia byssoidea VB512170]